MVAALYAFLAIVAASFVVHTAFLALSSANRVRKAGIKLPRGLKVTAHVLLLVGWPADVFYNWTVGTLRFRELPKELTYSARVRRHCRESASVSEWRYRKACAWRDILNVVDPGHI